jgi:hypothetical protein
MKRIARLFSSFIPKAEIILAITLSKNKARLCLQRKAQRGLACFLPLRRYLAKRCFLSFRMTKFRIACLVSPKKTHSRKRRRIVHRPYDFRHKKAESLIRRSIQHRRLYFTFYLYLSIQFVYAAVQLHALHHQ